MKKLIRKIRDFSSIYSLKMVRSNLDSNVFLLSRSILLLRTLEMNFFVGTDGINELVRW